MLPFHFKLTRIEHGIEAGIDVLPDTQRITLRDWFVTISVISCIHGQLHLDQYKNSPHVFCSV